MVARVVNDIAPVGRVRPDFFREKLVLRFAGPVAVAFGMTIVLALHFLQKHNVGIKRTQPLTQLAHDDATVKGGKAFVDIPGGDAQEFHAPNCHTRGVNPSASDKR